MCLCLLRVDVQFREEKKTSLQVELDEMRRKIAEKQKELNKLQVPVMIASPPGPPLCPH
jgi:adenylate kinase